MECFQCHLHSYSWPCSIYVFLHSSNIIQFDVQVACYANGGSFGLTFDWKTTFIDYDSDKSTIKEAIEFLANVNSVTVNFDGGVTSAYYPFDFDFT